MKTKFFPELWLIVFGFLLNFPWEMLQAPLFVGMADRPAWEITKHCAVAALGDVLILLACYLPIAYFSKNKRSWIVSPKKGELMVFLCIGLVITIVFEIIAVSSLDLWQYSQTMPTFFTIGLAPLLQWILLPLVLLYFILRVYGKRGTSFAALNTHERKNLVQ